MLSVIMVGVAVPVRLIKFQNSLFVKLFLQLRGQYFEQRWSHKMRILKTFSNMFSQKLLKY
jgi:hypothetical protein